MVPVAVHQQNDRLLSTFNIHGTVVGARMSAVLSRCSALPASLLSVCDAVLVGAVCDSRSPTQKPSANHHRYLSSLNELLQVVTTPSTVAEMAGRGRFRGHLAPIYAIRSRSQRPGGILIIKPNGQLLCVIRAQ